MKLNQELVKRLAAGEIQLQNNGTVEQLNEILQAAFPNDNTFILGKAIYYFKDLNCPHDWYPNETPFINLPIFTTEQFFEVETDRNNHSISLDECQDRFPDTKQKMDKETRELAKQLFVAKIYAGNLPSANAMNQAIDNAKQFIQLLNNE